MGKGMFFKSHKTDKVDQNGNEVDPRKNYLQGVMKGKDLIREALSTTKEVEGDGFQNFALEELQDSVNLRLAKQANSKIELSVQALAIQSMLTGIPLSELLGDGGLDEYIADELNIDLEDCYSDEYDYEEVCEDPEDDISIEELNMVEHDMSEVLNISDTLTEPEPVEEIQPVEDPEEIQLDESDYMEEVDESEEDDTDTTSEIDIDSLDGLNDMDDIDELRSINTDSSESSEEDDSIQDTDSDSSDEDNAVDINEEINIEDTSYTPPLQLPMVIEQPIVEDIELETLDDIETYEIPDALEDEEASAEDNGIEFIDTEDIDNGDMELADRDEEEDDDEDDERHQINLMLTSSISVPTEFGLQDTDDEDEFVPSDVYKMND